MPIRVLRVVCSQRRRGTGESTPEKSGGGLRFASHNRYSIYDQNLRFSLPHLWPDQTFDVLSHEHCGWHSCSKHNLWRAFVDVLIKNNGKVASSKKHTQFKTRVQKPQIIYDQNGQNRYPVYDQNGWKTMPFETTHISIVHLSQYILRVC